MAKQGSLVIVGTGINTLAHCSIEARAHIEQAEKLIVHVPDPLGMSWLRELHPDLVDLQPIYAQSKDRAAAYEQMIAAIVDAATAGFRTVAVFYGHPGVFVYPSHEAIRRLQAVGCHARMLPGISAEDCLFADLGIDPGSIGCTQFEATNFLFRDYLIDPRAGLILWQVGVVGDFTLRELSPYRNSLAILSEKLSQFYPPQHQVVLYEAASLAVGKARRDWLAIADMKDAVVTPISTLYVPPIGTVSADTKTLSRLGLTAEQVFPDTSSN